MSEGLRNKQSTPSGLFSSEIAPGSCRLRETVPWMLDADRRGYEWSILMFGRRDALKQAEHPFGSIVVHKI